MAFISKCIIDNRGYVKYIYLLMNSPVCLCCCCDCPVRTESACLSSCVTCSVKLARAYSGLGTYVTWQGNECELPEDDTLVSKHVGAW